MTGKYHDVHVYLQQQDYPRLEQEASSRGISLSKTVRHCLLEYLHLRLELATAIETPGEVGDSQSGRIIHTLLARTEERIAATIEQQLQKVDELHDQVGVLNAMIDRLYLGLMQHLPEIPGELTEVTVASATRRHKKWIEATKKIVQGQDNDSFVDRPLDE